MKLEIEKWVETTGIFESAAKNTFDEAVLCYKVGAYKSAFIMSYLSFKLTVKQRILRFDNNTIKSFTSNRWDNIIKELNDDDKWEERLNKEIVCKETSSIIKFTNKERMIIEFDYWKNIRNSCAHAKGQIIDASTVECFWNYLKDNLSKFYVLGGKDYIAKEFLSYFRYYKINEQNRDLDNILNDISVLYSDDVESFFNEILTDFENEKIELINSCNSEIWKFIFNYKNKNIKEGFLRCISNKNHLLIRFYSFFPDILINIIQLDKKFLVDRLSDFLNYVATYDYNNKYFLDILYKILLNYNEKIQIDSILKNDKYKFQSGKIVSMIEYLSEEKRQFLKQKDFFKKIIEIFYKWIYEIDANSQYNKFDKWLYETNDVIQIFKYINFDIELLKKINHKLEELSNSMSCRSSDNSITNGNNANNMFQKIIENSHDEITKLIKNTDDDFPFIQSILNKNTN